MIAALHGGPCAGQIIEVEDLGDIILSLPGRYVHNEGYCNRQHAFFWVRNPPPAAPVQHQFEWGTIQPRRPVPHEYRWTIAPAPTPPPFPPDLTPRQQSLVETLTRWEEAHR